MRRGAADRDEAMTIAAAADSKAARGVGMTLGQRVVGIVLLTALPLVAVTLLVIGQLKDAAREAQLAGLRYSAQAIAAGLDAELGKYRSLAEALSSSPNLLLDDLAAFEAEARRVFARNSEAWVIVADSDGRQLLNTHPDARDDRPMRHPDAIEAQRRAFATGAPTLSGVRLGPFSNVVVATIEAPVYKDGAPFRALAVAMTTAPFARLMAVRQAPQGWLSGVMDGAGNYVARLPDGERLAGQPASQGWRATRGRAGRAEFASRDGVEIVNENVLPAFGDWTVGVSVARDVLDSVAFRATRWSIFGALALLAMTLALAALAARGVMRPLSSLTAYVRDPLAPPPRATSEPEVDSLRRALVEAREDGARHERRQASLVDVTSRLLAIERRAQISDVVREALDPDLGVDLYLKYRFDPVAGALLLTHANGVPDALRAEAERLTPTTACGGDPILAAPAGDLLRRVGARAVSCHDLLAIDGAVLGAICFASTRREAFVAEERLYFGTLANIVSQAIERTEAEAALRHSHDTFRHLVEGSPFGIYTVDADFRLERVSQGARKIFSSVEARLGEDFDAVLRRIWTEPFVGEALARFREVIATGEPYHSLRTVENRRDTGDREAYDWKIERILLPDGRLGAVCHFYDLSERVRHEEELRQAHRRQAVLMRELAHRGKNLIAVVQAIASRSFVADRPAKESSAIFSGRLQALANTFATFNESSAETSPLRDIVATELQVYTDKVALDGPALMLSAAAAQTFALVVHELATNAAKYGALSSPTGRLAVTWGVAGDGEEETFFFDWRESGGPPVTAPTRRSFGTVLITQIAASQFGGAPDLSYEPGGLRYRLVAARDRLTS